MRVYAVNTWRLRHLVISSMRISKGLRHLVVSSTRSSCSRHSMWISFRSEFESNFKIPKPWIAVSSISSSWLDHTSTNPLNTRACVTPLKSPAPPLLCAGHSQHFQSACESIPSLFDSSSCTSCTRYVIPRAFIPRGVSWLDISHVLHKALNHKCMYSFVCYEATSSYKLQQQSAYPT